MAERVPGVRQWASEMFDMPVVRSRARPCLLRLVGRRCLERLEPLELCPYNQHSLFDHLSVWRFEGSRTLAGIVSHVYGPLDLRRLMEGLRELPDRDLKIAWRPTRLYHPRAVDLLFTPWSTSAEMLGGGEVCLRCDLSALSVASAGMEEQLQWLH